MRRYIMPAGTALDLDGCRVSGDSITLPFPLSYETAERLVFLATAQRFGSIDKVWPELGRCLEWVKKRWLSYGLPVKEEPDESPSIHAELLSPVVVELRRFQESACHSSCPECRRVAALLERMVCLPVPTRLQKACGTMILATLVRAGFNRSAACKQLGISRTSLHAWCKKLGIAPQVRASKD